MSQNPRKQKGNSHEHCYNWTVVYTPEIMETQKETAKYTAFRQKRTLRQYLMNPSQQLMTRTRAGDKEQSNYQLTLEHCTNMKQQS